MKKIIFIHVVLLYFSIVIFSGCLTPVKPGFSYKYYLNPDINEQKGEFTGLTLAIRGFENARSITNYIVFLEEGKLYYKEGLEWAEHPVDVIEKLVIKSIENTGRFRDIAESVEIKNPDLILIGKIEQFYIVKENNAEKVRVDLTIKIRKAQTSEIIFAKEFIVEKTFKGEEEKINDAMNRALSDLSLQLQKEINKIKFNENIS